jgi:hypothetical protein
MRIDRNCFACGTALQPYSSGTWTAHEFACGKAHPDKIPLEFIYAHRQTLEWEKRSQIAKRNASKRRGIP